MAMQNIILLAETKGLGSCVVHLSEQWKTANLIKQYFDLKETDELMGVITIGYSDEEVDYNTTTHAGRNIKRKDLEYYIKKEYFDMRKKRIILAQKALYKFIFVM